MRTIGLDVHQGFCEVAICERGELRSAGRIETTAEALGLFAQSLGRDDRVAMETSGPAFAIARILEAHVGEVIVTNAAEVRAISHARVKSDRFDARTLAQLAEAGMLGSVWVPDPETAALRRRIARRAALIRQRTKAKNEVHAVLARCLLGKPQVSDLFGAAGRRWLQGLELPAQEQETLEGCLREIEFCDREVDLIDRKLAAWAIASPETKRLMTIPGIGMVAVVTLMSAIGEISRFENPRQLVAYLGLDPTSRQSGDQPARGGRISKRGNVQARSVLVEAAWTAIRSPGPLRAFGQRVRARSGGQVAAVAVARKIAVLSWHLLSKGEDYAFGRPSLVRSKLRAAERLAGAPALSKRHGGSASAQRQPNEPQKARSPNGRKPPTGGRSPTGRRAERWAPARHRGAHLEVTREGTSSAAGPSPEPRSLARRLPAPKSSLSRSGPADNSRLDFHP